MNNKSHHDSHTYVEIGQLGFPTYYCFIGLKKKSSLMALFLFNSHIQFWSAARRARLFDAVAVKN